AADLPDLLSVPTRRSSDLLVGMAQAGDGRPSGRDIPKNGEEILIANEQFGSIRREGDEPDAITVRELLDFDLVRERKQMHRMGRSEEHTSELQSRENLVCR